LSPLALALLTPRPVMAGDPPSSDDVVETVQLPSERPAAQASSPPPEASPQSTPAPAEPTDVYSLTGWTIEELHLAIGQSPAAPPYLTVPLDRGISRTHAFVGFRYSHARWFEVDASSAISYDYFLRGSGTSVGDDLAHLNARGSFDPSVRELYLAFFGGSVELRLGQQRVAWGRADTQSPNDVLNARDLRDPFQPEPELAQIPTPLARLDWTAGGVTLEGVVAPFFVPDEFDVYGSNWALVQPDAPQGIRGFFKAMSSLVDSSLVDPFNRLVQQTRIPPPALSNCAAGLKVSSSLGDVDVDAYYHYGFDRTPLLRIDPAFQDSLDRTDFATAKVSDFGPFFSSIQAGFPPITIEYVRRHHVGFDMGTVVGPIGMRIDVGYDTQRVFFRRDFTGVTSPAVQGVASLEYQTGDVRKIFLLEASALRLVDDLDDLMFVERTTVTGTALLRYPLSTAFDLELRAAVSAMPKSTVLRPQIGWRASDHLTFHLAGLWLSGEAWSLGDYFARNSEVYADAKYSF
jgi:hypothetical protein